MVCLSKMCQQEAPPLWERYAIWEDCASWIAEAQDYAFVMKDYVSNQDYMTLQNELKDFYEHTNRADLVGIKKSICVLIKDYYKAKKKMETHNLTAIFHEIMWDTDERAIMTFHTLWNPKHTRHYDLALEYIMYHANEQISGAEKMSLWLKKHKGKEMERMPLLYSLLENGGIDLFEHELADSIPKIEANKEELTKIMIKMKVGKIFDDLQKGKPDEQIEKEEMELEWEYEEVLYAADNLQRKLKSVLNECGDWDELFKYNKTMRNKKYIQQAMVSMAANNEGAERLRNIYKMMGN